MMLERFDLRGVYAQTGTIMWKGPECPLRRHLIKYYPYILEMQVPVFNLNKIPLGCFQAHIQIF